MKQIAPLLLAASLALPVNAETNDKAEGLSLIERGADMFFRSLIEDMAPAMDDFRALAEEFGPQMQELLVQIGPKLEELAKKIDDITYYEAPEILPNGDIIMRRKRSAPEFKPTDEIEL